MTRKDFELIAEALTAARQHANRSLARGDFEWGIDTVAHELAQRLRLVNPRFKRDVFLKAASAEGIA